MRDKIEILKKVYEQLQIDAPFKQVKMVVEAPRKGASYIKVTTAEGMRYRVYITVENAYAQ